MRKLLNSKKIIGETLKNILENFTNMLKLGSHVVVKWTRALPSRKVVVITTSCEPMVVRVAVVNTLKKWSREISN